MRQDLGDHLASSPPYRTRAVNATGLHADPRATTQRRICASIGSQFVNLLLAGVTPDAAKWPKLSAYLGRIHSRPSFKPLIEGDKKMFRIE
jgi:hypothetical protein